MSARYAPGSRWNQLELKRYTYRDNNRSYGVFGCSCGAEKVMAVANVVRGSSKSCGDRERHPRKPFTHGTRYGYAVRHCNCPECMALAPKVKAEKADYEQRVRRVARQERRINDAVRSYYRNRRNFTPLSGPER